MLELREDEYGGVVSCYLPAISALPDREQAMAASRCGVFSPFVYKHQAVKQRVRGAWRTAGFAKGWLGSQLPARSRGQAALLPVRLPGEM